MDSNVEKQPTEMENMECVLSAPRKFCEVHGCDATDELSGIKTKSVLQGSNDNVYTSFPRCCHSMRVFHEEPKQKKLQQI